MPRIPMGNFGQVAPTAERNRVITFESNQQGQQAIAGAAAGIAGRQIDQQNQEAKALARVKASNLLLDRESQLNSITSELGEKLRRGELQPDEAHSAYESAVGSLAPVQPKGLDTVGVENFNLSLREMQMKGSHFLDEKIGKAHIAGAQADLSARGDMLLKSASLPGADPDMIARRFDQEDIDTAGRMAYGLEWDARKQGVKDGIYTTHAAQKIVTAGNDLGALKDLQHQLTAEDGYYTTKLDPDKRNQLLNSVTGKIFQVQEHNARQAEIREMKAMRIMDQMDKQAATGIPPSPAQQQAWQTAISGTSMAGEYGSRIQQMNEVQQLLRSPLPQQQAYLQQKRQQLATHGGSTDQIANLDRLERAVESNMQQMRDQPLEWNAMRTGAEIEPLSFAGIQSPEGRAALAAQIGNRFDVISAMRNQVGPEVSRNPFLPQEAAMLKSVIAQADDNTKLQILESVAQAAPSGSDFAGALKTIAADDPSLMLAGMAQAQQLKGSDGTQVGPTLLAGSKVLADKSTPLPTEAKLRTKFDEAVGQAIPSGTTQREQAFTAYKMLYAGLAGPAGVQHEGTAAEVDAVVSDRAIVLATGGISRPSTGWFGKGEPVVRPYGMPDDDFQDAVSSQLDALSEGTGFKRGQLESMPLMPVQGREGAYFLLNGGRPQVDPKTGEPMIVRVK